MLRSAGQRSYERMGVPRMEEGHNFKRLKAAVLALSEAQDWDVAKKEWRLVNISQADEPEICPCGHYPIMDLCEINNRINGKSIEVGNICVKRFLGFRSDLIFASVKRIKADIGKGIGTEAAIFFRGRGIINTWEYGFAVDTRLKRNLSGAQLVARRKINRQILASLQRRGIS